MERYDESVISQNMPSSGNLGKKPDFNLYRAMVIKVKFFDAEENFTKDSTSPRVLYDLLILGGWKSGQIISNARRMVGVSGLNNFEENVLKATSQPITGTRLQDHDGDIVFFQFLNGHKAYPIIIGLDQGLTVQGKPSIDASVGSSQLSEFLGVQEYIDAQGQYCLLRKGGKLDSETGVFTPNSDETQFDGKVCLNDGNIEISDPKNSIILTKEDNKLETILNLDEEKIKQTLDGKEESITTEFASGMKITEDGKGDKLEILCASGTKIEVDGGGEKITISGNNNTKVEIDGSSGKVTLSSDLVDLGSGASGSVTIFEQLAAAFNAHTHQAIVAGGSSSGTHPTTPPLSPLPVSVGSGTVKTKA